MAFLMAVELAKSSLKAVKGNTAALAGDLLQRKEVSSVFPPHCCLLILAATIWFVHLGRQCVHGRGCS